MKITAILVVVAISAWLVGCAKQGAETTGANQPSGSGAKMEPAATGTVDQAKEATDQNATVERVPPAEGSGTKPPASGSDTKGGGSDTKTPATGDSGTQDEGSGTK